MGETLLLGGFTLLLFRHQRMVFEYALVAAFVLARWVGLGDRGSVEVGARRKGSRLRNLLLVAGGLISVGALGMQYSTARFGLGVDDRFYPARIFSFVRQHELPDPTYISDAWGGHWLWEFYPERKVFYDNRLEAYSFEFFRDVYQSIRYGEPGWQEKLDSYGIRTLVLKYTTPGEREFQEGRPNIRDLVIRSRNWNLVFWDDLGMIYVRQPCPGCFRFGRLNPDTLAPVAGWDDPDLGRELRQAFALAPGERSGYALAAWLMRRDRVSEAADVLSEALRQVPDSVLLESLALQLADGGD